MSHSGVNGCVTFPARQCSSNIELPSWAIGKPLISKFLFKQDEIVHLRRGDIWAKSADPGQEFTAYEIIECPAKNKGRCKLPKPIGSYTHVQMLNAGKNVLISMLGGVDSSDWLRNERIDIEDEFPVIEKIPKWFERQSENLVFTGIPNYVEHPNLLLNYFIAAKNLLPWLKERHFSGFVHNDLKPVNMCFDGSNIRLIDFSNRTFTEWGQTLKYAFSDDDEPATHTNTKDQKMAIKDLTMLTGTLRRDKEVTIVRNGGIGSVLEFLIKFYKTRPEIALQIESINAKLDREFKLDIEKTFEEDYIRAWNPLYEAVSQMVELLLKSLDIFDDGAVFKSGLQSKVSSKLTDLQSEKDDLLMQIQQFSRFPGFEKQVGFMRERLVQIDKEQANLKNTISNKPTRFETFGGGLPPLHPPVNRKLSHNVTLRNTNGNRNYAIRAAISKLQQRLNEKDSELDHLMPEPYPETEEEIDRIEKESPGIFNSMDRLYSEIEKIKREIVNLNKLGGGGKPPLHPRKTVFKKRNNDKQKSVNDFYTRRLKFQQKLNAWTKRVQLLQNEVNKAKEDYEICRQMEERFKIPINPAIVKLKEGLEERLSMLLRSKPTEGSVYKYIT